MAATIDENGIQIETFEEIFSRLVAEYQAIYGADIIVDQDSPDGQRIGIQAAEILDAQQRLVDIYNSNDPDLATGLALQKILKQAGMYIRPATKSQWDLTVDAVYILTLPNGYTVRDDSGQLWAISADTVLAEGDNTVTFFAEQFGSVSGFTADVITPVTIVAGIDSIIAEVDALPGRDEEIEEEARQRRARSLENPGYSVLGSLFAKLGQITGVVDVAAYQNNTDTDDVARDIPARTVWAVVEGGAVSDIAEVLAKQNTAGSDWKGSVTTTYTETLVRPDGSEFTIVHDVAFDRPTDVDLYIRFTVVSSGTVDTAQIKSDLESVLFNIGESAQAGQLYQHCYGGGTGYAVTDLEISDDGMSWTDEIIDPALSERLVISAANITITGP